MKNKYLKPKKKQRLANPFVIMRGQYKDSKLEPIYRSEWSEDVYISENKRKETVGRSFNFSKLTAIGAIFFVLILILTAKTAWLQIAKGNYYYSMAEGNRVRIQRIEAKRGVIYDRNLRPLVRNKANFLLYFIPADLPDKEKEKTKLDGIFNRIGEIVSSIDSRELSEKISDIQQYSLQAYQPLFISDNIPYEEAMKLYLESDSWPGVVLTDKTMREYLLYKPAGGDEKIGNYLSLSHILGYTGKINEAELEQFGDEYLPIDYIGKMGIEYFWENELKGRSGKKQIEVDALGKEKKIIGQVKAVDGRNLVLSIDVMVQLELEKILKDQLNKLKLKRAAAIVTDPNNGEILALVSLPAYDNNVFARGITVDEYQAIMEEEDKPLFNRAISGTYPPGSTIKPVIAAAALQEGIITEHTTFLSVGGIRIGQWFFPDWRAGGHGRVNVRQAIANSVNTFFYYVGGGYKDFKGLGVDKIIHYAQLFGLGTQTGVDLAWEAAGFLPSREWKQEAKGERWYIGDTYHLAIGQGDLSVTPLQAAAYTGVFANGGKLYRPHLVRQLLTGADAPEMEIAVEPVREGFINLYNIKIVRQGMKETVDYGSARSLSAVPVPVAGKTGTAQWSSKHKPHAWFTGFAPFDNPELTITVLIEEGGEGSDTAVPVVRKFLSWYFGEYKSAENRP